LWLSFAGHIEKTTIQNIWKKMLCIKFPLFPYSSCDVCLETYSHDVKHAWKQKVPTSRLFYKISYYTRKACLCKKGAMSAMETCLKIICPPCVTAVKNVKIHLG
jgi:hypothetical protein